MKNRNRFGWLPVILLLVMAVGCSTPRTLGYLLDMEYNHEYPAAPAPELKMQIEDRLSIQVLSETPELSAPFNSLLTITDLANQTVRQPMLTYVIDKEGNIDFPILGTLHVEGKTLKEIEQMIADEIISRGYIKNPVVNAELDNFQVTFIGGGAAGGGVMQVQGHSFNLLQAIARIRGTNNEEINIREVTVIRTENGVRTAYSVNMQKKALFDSPVFYLQQNDVIYYKPNVYRLSQTAGSFIGFVGTLASIASLVLSYLALTR
ncbi:MAG: polysaccharide biosynthesis/export family protein [Bacteroidales bacterium]|nr:polysaccharide biosynthesis/export family protein [Bacteroidales bacterium]